MKATTLLVALALVALAAAQDYATQEQSSTYVWWTNFTNATLAITAYLGCLSAGWVSAFFANDGGSQFYRCLLSTG